MVVALVALVLASSGGLAAAQPIATQPATETATTTAPPPAHPPAGLGAGVTFGWGGQRHGREGWVARLEYEAFPVYGEANPVGAVFGFQPGFEVWRSGENNWGFSLPIAIVLGIRAFPVRGTVGVGFDAFLIDQVDDDTGVGFWAPFAMARFGADVLGYQVGADARYGYRWQFGADDHARWQLGVYVAKTFGSARRTQPMY